MWVYFLHTFILYLLSIDLVSDGYCKDALREGGERWELAQSASKAEHGQNQFMHLIVILLLWVDSLL